MNGVWVPPDTRDEVVDFVKHWNGKTEIQIAQIVKWLGIAKSKFYDWRERYGMANEHNGKIPRDFWIEDWEREAILAFHSSHPLNGYRRLTYMMMDNDIVALSPSTVYRVLKRAGVIDRNKHRPSSKGTGFVQPLAAHDHWHIDISYVNVSGTFCFLCAILDGYSRYIVHWEVREQMKETDIELIVQRAREKFPHANPRIISDNGPQFVARDFKEFIRLCGMTHVRTSPYYPQSNGKLERWHREIKTECIRPKQLADISEVRIAVAKYVITYNNERLHSSIGYVTPKDKLEGRDLDIFKARDRKLEKARELRKQRRQGEHVDASEKIVIRDVESAHIEDAVWSQAASVSGA